MPSNPRAWSLGIMGLLLLLAGSCTTRRTPSGPVPAGAIPEIRALWVDGFHEGIRSPAEAERLVESARRAHLNMLIVQVRRRADAYYTRSFEPPVDEPAYDPAFDALGYAVDLGHRAGLEVHAWVNAMPVWRDEPPPRDPRHVFNQHGPLQGADSWLTSSPSGDLRFPVGYFLDPGHPAAAAHVAQVYRNIVQNYDIDGIHFDYIRYPETEPRLPRGAAVGYNPTSLARFRRFHGRSDTPAHDDPQWTEWRRSQVTQLVRRIYLESKSVKPHLKVSAAVIAWGAPPRSEEDFLDMSPGQRIFQDWHGWLQEGILDLAIPMNYARESDPVVRGWFDGWIAWEKQHKHGRQLAIGIGAYLNPVDSALAQIERARARLGRHAADGISLYSYANPGAGPEATAPAGAGLTFLSGTTGSRVPFAGPAPVPRMPWIDQPEKGAIAGLATDTEGRPLDGGRLRIKKAGWWSFLRRAKKIRCDGNGFFGLSGLLPGRYRIEIPGPGGGTRTREVEVLAGRVATVLP